MSAHNVETVRRFQAEFNDDGWDALWRIADPEIGFHEPPEQPGATVFRGIDAVRRGVAKSWQENWIEQPAGTIVTLRGGKIVRFEAFRNQQTLLDAAGIAE
jgi:ketosteroid isomerase-like protein